jgi:hypothetical protein
MSSESSTERGSGRESGFQLWHVYLILSMSGAIWAVIVSRHTHPAALLLISAAVVAAGLVGLALNHAFAGFFGAKGLEEHAPISARTREALLQEKALVLRSIKELEFDHAMRKVSDDDFAEVGGRLRERAMVLMEDIERTRGVGDGGQGAERPPSSVQRPSSAARPASGGRPTADVFGAEVASVCASCGTESAADARFCKNCGAKL